MTSKELMGHLEEMKIPAKSPSSALEDAYVSMVRKKLAPVLEARAAEIEAQRKAEEEAAAAEEAERARKAEEERLAAEARAARRSVVLSLAAQARRGCPRRSGRGGTSGACPVRPRLRARPSLRPSVALSRRLTRARVSARCSTRLLRRRSC